MSASSAPIDQSRIGAVYSAYNAAYQGTETAIRNAEQTISEQKPGIEQRITRMKQAQEQAVNDSLKMQNRMVPLKRLSETTAALVDYVMSQGSGDGWEVSFGYLVTLSVSGLSAARIDDDATAEAAMLSNLYGFLDALQARYAVEPTPLALWARSIEAFGPRPAPPESPDVKHPHRTNLGRHIRSVRDLALRSFQAYYALDKGSVHVIRPA